jgi:xylulokinase
MICLLGIDAGTTSFKAVLFDQNGGEITSAIYEYELHYPGVDLVELETEMYWEACKTVIRMILTKWDGNLSDIKALSIASQGETLIALDQNGKPLRPAIVWLDNRANEEAERIRQEFGIKSTYKITGQPDIVPTWPAAKVLWLKENEADVFNRVQKYLLLEDYLIYRLTNQFVAEGSLLSSTLYFNIHSGQWWADMLRFIGISAEQLPEIKESGRCIGELTDAAAKETGLAKETLVVTGALDQAASTIGAGNTCFDVITESTGGVLAICANVPKAVIDPGGRIPCHYHAVPGAYFLLPWCQTAGMVYKWFRNEFYDGKKIGDDLNAAGLFKKMDEDASLISPGSEGLIILPHLAGAFTPESNPRARGVFFGISLQTRREHFSRAILESVAFMLKRNIKLLEDLGTTVHEIRSLGGGSKSELWNQIKSDVCQKPLVTMQTPETTSLGAAMLASVALNLNKNLEQAAEKMSYRRQRFEPNPANEAPYRDAYQKYIKLYDTVEPLF